MAQPWPRKHATRMVPMPIDETKLNDLPGRFGTDPGGTGHVTSTERIASKSNWHMDHRPSGQSVSFRMSQSSRSRPSPVGSTVRDHPP
jgi:hypothetical protein